MNAINFREPRFANLGAAFYTRLPTQHFPSPYSICASKELASQLGLDDAWLAHLEGLQGMATVYSGHQFGVWAGQLGDGRALLLGDIEDTSGNLLEVQLKGAGRTPYSRGGDGRAVLRSSIREFLCSEAMHGLGIPTTRALSVVGSDLPVRRETTETAAVVTRVAQSFIRFGHFEHFSYAMHAEGSDHTNLQTLADFVIAHFYPECKDARNPYAALLAAVTTRTAALVAAWQAVGFCHGVLNSDNMSILGLTLDYGPFQFLDGFNPAHICNHSDTQGRYAYNRQPNICYWNLFCLGQALLPLITLHEKSRGVTDDDAIQQVTLDALEPYKTLFPQALQAQMQRKLGLTDWRSGSDPALVEDILKLLASERTDYTIFWRKLSHAVSTSNFETVRDLFKDRAKFDDWHKRYASRIAAQDKQSTSEAMLGANPAYVLRNHLAQTAIESAQVKDFSEVNRLLEALQNPFVEKPEFASYAAFPPDWASQLEISCSS